MRFSVVVCGLLFLNSCAPLLQLAQPKEKARLYRDGLTVIVDNSGATEALTGNPKVEDDGLALTVDGVGLTLGEVAGGSCKEVQLDQGNSFECVLKTIPAGSKTEVVFASGQITDYVLSGYRASSGAKPVVLWGE